MLSETRGLRDAMPGLFCARCKRPIGADYVGDDDWAICAECAWETAKRMSNSTKLADWTRKKANDMRNRA